MTLAFHRRQFLAGLAAAAAAPSVLRAVARPLSSASHRLPLARAEAVGMSSSRLATIDAIMADYIARNEIQGGVTAVARRNRIVHLRAHGAFDIEAGTPMPEAAIFRLMSSTKPITGVALLQQMELGRVSLTDPIGRFIPELRSMQVMKPDAPHPSPLNILRPLPHYSPDQLEPQAREITIKDLATHSSGLNAVLPHRAGDTLATYLPRLQDQPLEFQPGSRWGYSALTGPDILARVVEITSGMTYDRYLADRIFDPIGMVDTGHNLTEEQWRRVVHRDMRIEGAWRRPTGNELAMGDVVVDIPLPIGNTTYFDGSGGLKSSALDQLLFYAMLANHGTIHGRRLLRPESVELMRSDLLNGLFRGPLGSETGLGFGVLASVMLDPAAAHSSRPRGSFGWGGAFGTNGWADPAHELAAVLMVQQPVHALGQEFDAAVSGALLD